jgi:hypothetical protein
MAPPTAKSILLLDPATSWGNKYDCLISALESAEFDVYIFEVVPYKDKAAYKALVDECILLLEMCDILLKPQNDIVDYWLFELGSKHNVGLKRIMEYANSNNKIIVTFQADWAGFTPDMDNIYFDDDARRVVAEIQSKIGPEGAGDKIF